MMTNDDIPKAFLRRNETRAICSKKLSVQVRDTRGTLAYWHPAYVKAYFAVLHAYAEHLKHAPYRANVLGVRLNFNALGTEHTAVRPEDQDPSRWTVRRLASDLL